MLQLTVYHDYIGPRSYRVSASTSVQDVKQMLYEETDLPVAEQQLTHSGKRVSCLSAEFGQSMMISSDSFQMS